MTKRKLEKIENNIPMNYSIWLKLSINERKNYLKRIEITDERRLKIFSMLAFHHLPSTIRSDLQLKLRGANN